ncbi:hypothetical protein HanRHA438_Chr09g0419961 [Helianthus annuus]|nr:hypothetical protein HanRHA438_Chr09g0419961 [Helianthus annuus]
MYKSSPRPIIPLVEGSSSGAGATESDDVGSSVPQTGGEPESIEDAPPLPASLPLPPPPPKPTSSDSGAMLPPPPPMPLPPGTAGTDREKSQSSKSDDMASVSLPPPPPSPGLPPKLTGNQSEGASEPNSQGLFYFLKWFHRHLLRGNHRQFQDLEWYRLCRQRCCRQGLLVSHRLQTCVHR